LNSSKFVTIIPEIGDLEDRSVSQDHVYDEIRKQRWILQVLYTV